MRRSACRAGCHRYSGVCKPRPDHWSRSNLSVPPARNSPGAFAPLTLQASDLGCVRGGTPVFSGLTFSVPAGAFLAVTGANGSGKSSLLRILAGLLRPEAGGFTVEGRQREEAVVHYLGHADGLKPPLTLGETLRFWAALYRGRGDPAEAAGHVGLGHALGLPVGVLSAGQRRRAGLARLLIAPRPLWLLDEPASALDQNGEAMLAALLDQHRSAGGIVVAALHGSLPLTRDAELRLGES